MTLNSGERSRFNVTLGLIHTEARNHESKDPDSSQSGVREILETKVHTITMVKKKVLSLWFLGVKE